MRLGEALTRGAFLSDTSCAAIDAGISRTGRFHPATPVDNCALRQLRIHEYDCRILRNRFSRLASATVGFWQDGTSAMARWAASSPAPSTSTSGARGLPRHRRRAFERQQRHLDLAALLSVQLNPTDSRCKNNWRPMCCKYNFSRQDIVLYTRQRRTPV